MTSRKQREISHRHELILDKARHLFISNGYHCVTMDMIAKEMEYSKGTIYQHFTCKECIITSLCIRFCSLVYKLISCVSEQQQLNPRMQMLLIQEAFIMVHETCQDDVQIKNLADSEPFCTKVPPELTEKSNQIQQMTFAEVVKIVNRAIANKQLKINENATGENVAMGCWSLAHGTFMLTQPNGCVSSFNLTSPQELLRVNSQFYLDGVGWEAFTLTKKRQQFIVEFSEKFKLIIEEHYPCSLFLQETSR